MGIKCEWREAVPCVVTCSSHPPTQPPRDKHRLTAPTRVVAVWEGRGIGRRIAFQLLAGPQQALEQEGGGQ